ncbi:MAG: response regulator [Verrucomicrobia bacterium]|nr:response regulator [Verrucomicrobiota bacterium]
MSDNRKILVIEDSEDDFILLSQAIKRAKISVPLEWITDGQQAIDFFAGDKLLTESSNTLPALVLLDIKLPYKTGFEVLHWIRDQESLKELPVVMLTSSNETVDREKATRYGANSYLVKPSSIDALSQMMKQLHAEWFR